VTIARRAATGATGGLGIMPGLELPAPRCLVKQERRST
jgi:hypothetical protein